MKCLKCNSENIRVYVSIRIYVDYGDQYKISKKTINKRSTEIWAKDDKDSFVCVDCCYGWGYGYGNLGVDNG